MKLNNQKGAATLLVSIVLLIGVTLITIFAARIGVMDQRISANEYRHKEAKAAADAALDQAASFVANNAALYDGTVSGVYPWVECAGALEFKFPCGNGVDERFYDKVYDGNLATTDIIESLQEGGTAVELDSGISSDAYLTYTTSGTVGNILTAIGKGSSLDGTGHAYAKISYTEVTLLTPGKVPPIMTPSIKLSGNFTIIGDPNGGGPGVPISAWVSTLDVSGGVGSWQTCQMGDLRDGGNNVCADTRVDDVSWSDCDCVAGQELSKSGTPHEINYDISEVGADAFPDSTFHYLFPALNTFSDLLNLKDVVELPDCSTIKAEADTFTKSTIVAVTGNCSIPAGDIIGSRAAPIILVVNGELKINANTDFYGMALGLGQISLNGTATIHGSLLAEDATNLSTGGYTQVYDNATIEQLKNDLETIGLAKQKYSWTDIQP